MSREGNRRRRKPNRFDILVVSSGEGTSPKRFSITPEKMWLGAGLALFVVSLLVILVLAYTPLGVWVPIHNAELEKKYGKRVVEAEERLSSLAEQMMVVRDYNLQLRKVLGEQGPRDTVAAGKLDVSVPANRAFQLSSAMDRRVAPENLPPANADDIGSTYSGYRAASLGVESFRGAFPLLTPTEGYVTQQFNPAEKHYGIDYATKRGTPVYAATNGYVVFSSWTYEDGNMVIVSHGGGYLTVYKHNQTLLKSSHSYVKRGELIALVGSTGKTSQGPHLHFEVWKDGVPLDPNEFLLVTSGKQ